MDEVRVGVIGAGFMGKCHSVAWSAVKPIFGEVPKPRLLALCDIDRELVTRRAGEFGFERAETDWRAVVGDSRIDAVSITTPNASHRQIAIAALQAGKHVWCEKPMALTLDDAEAMAEAAGRSGKINLLGYNFARNPILHHACRLIAEGAIGTVFDFRGQVDEDYLADPNLPWSWRLRRADAGLGTLGDIMCHLLSLALLLVGEIGEVAGMTKIVHANRRAPGASGSELPVENEDLAHAIVRFRSGATGVLASSRVAHGRKNVIRVEVHGTEGMIFFDQERMNELQLFTAEGPVGNRGFRTVLTGPQHPPYGLFCPAPGHQLGFNDLKTIEAAHFLRCMQGLEQPLIDFCAGLNIERAIHGIERSAAEGSRMVAI